MSEKKVVWPQHKVGKYCGYSLYEDGAIEVAPTYSDIMEEVQLEQASIDALLKSVTEQCQKLLLSVEKKKRRFWESACEDYGLDLHAPLVYDFKTKTISLKKDDKP